MKTIDFYIDKAKKVNDLSSDLALNRALGFKGSMCSMLRKGKTHLSEEKMIELAKLADESPLIALADLNIWRATGAAKTYYMASKKALEKAALSIAIFALTAPALCQPAIEDIIYYVN